MGGSLGDLCKELTFSTQLAEFVKPQFIQFVEAQRVLPPVPGEVNYPKVSRVGSLRFTTGARRAFYVDF